MQPFTLLIKPSGSECNIDCAYCFYKDRLPELGQGKQRMRLPVLQKLVKDYMQTRFPVVGFAWQGGEPTLMGIPFFQQAVEFQKQYGIPGQQVSNTFQTNAVLLGKSWCRFLHDKKFLLGISVDGPERFHNRYRRDRAGAGTYTQVMRGIENCKKHRVEFSALVLLNSHNVEHPDELFDFAVKHELTYLQFIPCLERDAASGRAAAFSVKPRQYGAFLCRLFDLWCDYGPDRVNIREFDSLVTYYVLGKPTLCTYSEECGRFVVVEHNGDAFACEFFVEPGWRLGNILETPLQTLAASDVKKAFALQKRNFCPRCEACQLLEVCRGGCMKDRTRLGGNKAGPQPSYFCEAYRKFFEYALPRFREIAEAVKEGRLARHTRDVENVRTLIV